MRPISISLRATTLMAALICVDLLLNGCGNSGNSTPSVPIGESMLIEPGVGVGKVRTGMTADEVERALSKPDSKSETALFYPKLGISVRTRGGVVTSVDCGHPGGRNHPYAEAFKGRTKEGIGMDSTRADVIKAFGQPSKTGGEGGFELLAYHDKWLTFGLTDGKVHSIKVGLQAPK